jgi:hypothetical protein
MTIRINLYIFKIVNEVIILLFNMATVNCVIVNCQLYIYVCTYVLLEAYNRDTSLPLLSLSLIGLSLHTFPFSNIEETFSSFSEQ